MSKTCTENKNCFSVNLCATIMLEFLDKKVQKQSEQPQITAQ